MSSKKPFEKLGSFDAIHLGLVSDLISVDDSTVWSCSHDRRILVWDSKGTNISKIAELNAHSSKVNCLVQTSKNVWSCSSDKSLLVWDKYTRKLVKDIPNAHEDSVLCGDSFNDTVYTGSASLCKTLRSWFINESREDSFISDESSVMGLISPRKEIDI